MEKPDFVLELEKQAALAVAKLRQDNFSKNIPFMLGDMGLPAKQFYYEYANGDIAISEFPKNEYNHRIIRYLSKEEAIELKIKHNLIQ
jgi:hypothetical protein